MENHSTEDHEQGRVYHYRKTSWLGIVFLFLMLMAILGWAARYYTLPPWGAWLVLLFLIWLVLVARLALPWSIVAISISREKITLQQKNGKEITRVTEMTGINERGGRVMQIKGLTPSSKKTSIAITRDQLGKEQYKDFRDYLRQSFPDEVQVFPPIGAVRKGFGWFTRVLAWLILLSSFVVAAAAYTENEMGLMIFTFVIFIISVFILSLSCFLFSRWHKRLILPFICVPLAAFITLALIVF